LPFALPLPLPPQFNDQPGVGNNSNTSNRRETYFFDVDTPGAYSRYRLRVIETFGTTNDRPQLTELQLFAPIPEPASAGLLLVAGGALLLRRQTPLR
jgi:hypothetical protein